MVVGRWYESPRRKLTRYQKPIHQNLSQSCHPRMLLSRVRSDIPDSRQTHAGMKDFSERASTRQAAGNSPQRDQTRGDKKDLTKGTTEFLPFIARPLPAQLIVAPPQIVALIRRQILKAIPLFAEMFFVLRRKILPALIVALNILFLFGTETAPIVAAIP
jgi:hypothetical protein